MPPVTEVQYWIPQRQGDSYLEGLQKEKRQKEEKRLKMSEDQKGRISWPQIIIEIQLKLKMAQTLCNRAKNSIYLSGYQLSK